MKKIILPILLSFALANAGLIDAIALTVNDDAITLYDIDEKSIQTNGNKNIAVDVLVEELLYKQELKKHNIEASSFELNEYMEKLAKANGMDLYEFKAIVRQKYSDFSQFEDEIKQRILHEKLIQKLVKGNIKFATSEDIQIFYNNNKAQFTTASKFTVTEYVSKNKAALEKIKNNRALLPKGVKKQKITLKQGNLNPQMKFMLNDTQTNSFTPIFTANQNYVTLLINQKNGESTETLEQAEQKIFGILMKQRENKFLKEYFENLKLTADIKVIR